MRTYTNLRIVCMDDAMTLIENGYLEIEDGVFTDIGHMDAFQKKDASTIIDCEGMIAMPGLINAHTHLGLVALRSLADDMPDRLRKFLFPMEQKYMDRELTILASKYAAYESLSNGTTTVADMYYYSDDVATCLDKVGIRALVGQTIIRDSQIDYKTETQALHASEKLIHKWKGHSRITPFIAPHGTTTVSPDTLRKIHNLSRKTQSKVMMHVAEMDYEMTHFSPLSPFDFLNDLGLLDENFIAVHAIHTHERDHQLMAKTKTSVVHCPGANMKAGKGIADINNMVKHSIPVALGTDGPISGNTLDLMTPMKLAALSQKTRFRERDLFPSSEILKMSTLQSARVLGISKHTGSLECGKAADVLLISTDQPNMYPIYDIYATLVYQLQTQNIHTVIVNGVEKVRNHQLLDICLNHLRFELNEFINKIRADIT